MKVVSQVRSHLTLLEPGDHIVRIAEVREEFLPIPKHMAWTDQTPQIAIRFQNDEGSITYWINMKGYMTSDDVRGIAPKGCSFASSQFGKEQYIINTSIKKRIENPEKSLIGPKMIGDIAGYGGIPSGTEISLSSLINLRIQIHVRTFGNTVKVIRISSPPF